MGCIQSRKVPIMIDNKVLKKSTNKTIIKESNNQNMIGNMIYTKADNISNRSKKCLEKFKIERGLFVQGFSVDPMERYEILNTLGEGSYGKVYKVKIKNSEVYRAMKVIKKRYQSNKVEEEKIIKEIKILRKLDHPNIIKVFEFYNTISDFYIISELCSGGELLDRIIKLKKFTERVAAQVMKQLLSAVQFCHNNQIIHRDLKPENILIETPDGNEKEKNCFIIKVIDFGTAEIFKNNTYFSKQMGTPYYIAPEILNNKYNEKCDIWSCGIILFILLCGCPPFYGKNDNEIFDKIKIGQYAFKQNIWNQVSEDAKNLIKSLLEFDFTKRPTPEKVLKHPWFINTLGEGHKKSDETFETDNESAIIRRSNTEKRQSSINIVCGFKEALLNLKNFRAERKLQQATLYFMVQQLLSSEEVKEIRETFFKFDENQDGRLTKEEIFQGFKKSKFCRCTKEEIENIMELVDIDKNGFIEFQEFISATFSKKKILTEDNLKLAFDMFDKDKSGKISSDELKYVLKASNEDNEEVWKNLISGIDIDGDGEISYYEFCKMMYNLISST